MIDWLLWLAVRLTEHAVLRIEYFSGQEQEELFSYSTSIETFFIVKVHLQRLFEFLVVVLIQLEGHESMLRYLRHACRIGITWLIVSWTMVSRLTWITSNGLTVFVPVPIIDWRLCMIALWMAASISIFPLCWSNSRRDSDPTMVEQGDTRVTDWFLLSSRIETNNRRRRSSWHSRRENLRFDSSRYFEQANELRAPFSAAKSRSPSQGWSIRSVP